MRVIVYLHTWIMIQIGPWWFCFTLNSMLQCNIKAPGTFETAFGFKSGLEKSKIPLCHEKQTNQICDSLAPGFGLPFKGIRLM